MTKKQDAGLRACQPEADSERPPSTPKDERYANWPPVQHPRVRGRCPSCGADSLFLGSGGYVTCSVIGCKDPGAAYDALSHREQCICAAIKMPNGEVWRGHRHDNCIQAAGRAGASLEDIYAAEQGFITSRNRFVSRGEGAEIQQRAGIVSADSGRLPVGMLFSEDLYLRSWRDKSIGVECVSPGDTHA